MSARGPTCGHRGRTDIWELRLERFLSLGSHRPCCDAQELGSDAAAPGGLPSDPQDASARSGSRVTSTPLEKSPSSWGRDDGLGGEAQTARVPPHRCGTLDALNKAAPQQERVGQVCCCRTPSLCTHQGLTPPAPACCAMLGDPWVDLSGEARLGPIVITPRGSPTGSEAISSPVLAPSHCLLGAL